MNEGRNVIRIAIWLACTCFLATMEMSIPSDMAPDQKDDRDHKEKDKAPLERDVEDEGAHQQRQDEIDEPQLHVGDELSDQELRDRDGRGDELLHRPPLPLPGDRSAT